ncbi:SDR family oxidoreductase [Shewanella cyperi]|uniref:SDR family oxidoreductase n=1 Tax=Shewanella cyperi TaxID=2814292 RepID=A0A974XQR1_9GAMM|nr:SDR family oxidoreductase [Shewanella cyperi]QSX31693.1 SDR family oxidoreductase [Shewanella cyperi]
MQHWALITGGSRRIGAAIARNLHGAGYNVALHYHESAEEATALAAHFNSIRQGSCRTFRADLSDAAELDSLIDQVKQLSGLKVLVNNAAVFTTDARPFSRAQASSILNTNLLAPYALATALAPLLAQQLGVVINLLDIHGRRPLKGHGLYSISKAALEMATLSLAQELAPSVRVNGVAPGAILWPETSDGQAIQQVLGQIPLSRAGEPEDIARTVRFLVEAPYISGQVIAVDGGRSACGFQGAG